MTLRQFIRDNREAIDSHIYKVLGVNTTWSGDRAMNNQERETWGQNDEFLYWWARDEGWPG